jgi:hypothetical protein
MFPSVFRLDYAGGRAITPAESECTSSKQGNRLYSFPGTYKASHGTQDTGLCYIRERSNVWGLLVAENRNHLPLFPSSFIRFSGYNSAYWMCDVRAISVSELFMFKIRGEFLLQWSIREMKSVKGTYSHDITPFPEQIWNISWCWVEICERCSSQ